MMNSNFYIHDTDRKALEALKAIPGFTQLFKAFMKIWSEKQFKIQNMSSNIRISEKQLSKYYDMLPPICEKLGIAVPEMYLTLDVFPNAYTAGDTEPFIVITSGLLETMPDELIATVIAHECGHIACHHCLYRTMGQFIISEAVNLLGLGDLAIMPIQVAFAYWMRCSELSADRAAAICDGSSDKVVEMCMRFSGYDKDIAAEANAEEFMNQAIEYKAMVDGSKWNKTLEFIMYNQMSHPLNAVRAYECNQWAKTDRFKKLVNYIGECGSECRSLSEYMSEIPMPEMAKAYTGRFFGEVVEELQALGFVNVKPKRTTETAALATVSGSLLMLRLLLNITKSCQKQVAWILQKQQRNMLISF